MTWKEFKDAAESQGVADDDVIAWIDISWPNKGEMLEVHKDSNGEVLIS